MTLNKCTPEQLEIFRAEINEFDDEKIHENVRKIQDWIQTKPHLPQNYDKRILLGFIRGCKHDLEKVKRKLDVYFLVRIDIPDFFNNRDPYLPNVQAVLTNFIYTPLPNLTPDGSRVSYFSFPKEADQFDVITFYKVILMISDLRLIEEGAIKGDIFIFNTENISAKQMTKIITPFTKKILMVAQEAYPQRLAQIHVIGTTGVVEKAINFFRMFLKPAMKNRFHVHSKADTLHEFIPKSCLPKDLAGDLESSKEMMSDWKKKVETYAQYLKDQESIHTDREKISSREEICQNEDLFGTEGSFRTLRID